ncbi:hypothetical protein [Synechococcus sp. BIOS-E4-1]|nr:hypothetical protein [Synechococcus sp. BIOS-E4-1]
MKVDFEQSKIRVTQNAALLVVSRGLTVNAPRQLQLSFNLGELTMESSGP